MKQLKIIALLGAASMFTSVYPVVQLGEGVASTDLTRTVSAKAFDRYNGTFYIGTTGGAYSPTYSIAKAAKTDTYFTAIANASYQATGIEIGSLALVNNSGVAASHLAFAPMAYTSIATGTLLNAIILSSSTYTTTGLAYALTGTGVSTAVLPANFDLLAGSTNYVFARVHPFAGIGLYDGIGSGISAVYFNGTDAPSSMGNALPWNAFRGAFYGSGAPMRIASTDASMTGSPHVNDLYWDPAMPYGSTAQYAGTLFITGTVPARLGTAGNGYYSAITTATIRTGQLSLMDVLPNGVNPQAASYDQIFADNVGNAANNATIVINKIRTMKTTTGKYYLIVNGGVEKVGGAQCGNEIYALRYSNTSGYVIQNNKDANDLPNNFTNAHLYGDSAISLTVGGGPAPWQKPYYTSDMQVIGDAVYVSFEARSRGSYTDPGVWCSQAMFDNNGVIIGWTKWERVTPSFGQASANLDCTHFFASDASTGKFWMVTENTSELPVRVYRTDWDTASTDFTDNSLPDILTTDFSDYGVFSNLDLTSGTTFIGNSANTNASISLFGGYEKVAIARTEKGGGSTSFQVVTDFSAAADYLKSTITGAGCIRSLGYSRYLTDQTNNILPTAGYFFAGCDQGLYVYAKTADYTGFSTDAAGGISAINTIFVTTPFSWQRLGLARITGTVTHIDSDGKYVYVVEQDLTSIDSNDCKLWAIKLADSKTAMDPATDATATFSLIAHSGNGSIPANAIITGFKLIEDSQYTGPAAYGLISTNAGLFKSSAALNTLANITWTAVDATHAYLSIFAPKRTKTAAMNNGNTDGAATKFFGIHFVDGSEGHSYFQNSAFDLISSSTASGTATTLETPYTNNSMATGTDTLTNVDRSLYFYTDGGRRFYSRFSPDDTQYNAMRVLPFEAQPWAMTTAYAPTELTSIPRVYWIDNIAGNGELLAGTDTGVIALE